MKQAVYGLFLCYTIASFEYFIFEVFMISIVHILLGGLLNEKMGLPIYGR